MRKNQEVWKKISSKFVREIETVKETLNSGFFKYSLGRKNFFFLREFMQDKIIFIKNFSLSIDFFI